MRYIFFVVALLFFTSSRAQLNLSWARSMGGPSNDLARKIEVDVNGNTFFTGCFSGTVDFDPGPGVFNLTSAGGDDIFVSKFDEFGNLVWAKRIGGIGNDCGNDMKLSVFSGSLLIKGYFNGTVDFNPGAGTNNYTSNGSEDYFILSLNASGEFVWAASTGGPVDDSGFAITTDASGNVYSTGIFSGTADLNPGPGTNNHTSNGAQDIFISKSDPSGNFVWARSMGGPFYDGGVSIATDAMGNVFTTGYFDGTVDFDPGAGTSNLTSSGGDDIFISKLDASGNFVSAKRIGGPDYDEVYGIVADASGNLWFTGYFAGTVDFNPGAGTNNLTSAGGDDIFVFKLDASGNFVWAKSMGGPANDYSNSLTVDAAGKIWFTGSFMGTADFDPGPGTSNLISAGSWDIFVSQLDPSGNFVSAVKMGGAGYEAGNSLVRDASGNLWLTGFFEGTADFDPGPGTANLTSAGGNDIFVVKLSQAVGLPVTLTNIKAYQKNAGVQVEWIAQQENNIEKYEVERTANGQQFSKLGTVQANASSIVINYELFDPNPFRGVNYYRIKIIDKSGQLTYSPVMKVNIRSGASLITVYPNPVNGNTIVLQMNNLQKGSYTITLTNTSGQQIVTKLINHIGGSATETIDPSKVLATGIYQLTLTGGGINMTRQVIKK